MPADSQYSHQQQHQPPWSQQSSHLLHPIHTQQSAFPSPSSPTTSLSDHHYPPFYSQQQSHSGEGLGDRVVDRSHTALSLNLSSLTVASPTSLSPVGPHSSTHAHVSPITPISPAGAIMHTHQQLSAQHAHLQPFQFSPDHDSAYDYGAPRRLTSSRSSSSSDRSVPRKRSFTTPLATSVEEPYEHASYEDVDMGYALDPEGSPVDGSTSGGEQDDQLKPLSSTSAPGSTMSLTLLGKPLGTNNFVTKLYQMINDPKSAQFITWTELGTSFVVSNVGEFSRSILGSHFKHNNFSSFVRQLNMYGFHKINRTPRAQRTSTDVQTWEFSHHKFLRGRPDLLEEIKRKALEPDPSLKHRIELPGEVAAQLSQVREDNRRLTMAMHAERSKVDRLAAVTKVMYDTLTKAFPGGVPIAFPNDILETADSPNIYITSPTNAIPSSNSFPASLSSLPNPSLHSLHSLSPGSSPTASEFPSHTHTPHTLSRQHSFQHIPYDAMHTHPGLTHVSSARYEAALSTPLPPSPGGPGDAFDERVGAKRQRTGPPPAGGISAGGEKKGSRARSDSAPLGYGFGSGWTQTRPRSGSGLGSRMRRDEGPIPNLTGMRGHALPILSIPSPGKQSPGS
ncbi:predicted protein [Sparassis crispa]|uniref:HSF-type DNA-binding domain-containing protein n=1 Tax=Sparassis crispa TaxID=139825 RepID=A0A401H516_9APHY|nr:predicted protein [Sparassis crispa]GBE89440.1 predicted protein [Sparassis crispa]